MEVDNELDSSNASMPETSEATSSEDSKPEPDSKANSDSNSEPINVIILGKDLLSKKN